MSARLVGSDSSVLIPALAPIHPEHALCRPQLRRVTAIPAHALLETYRVLTSAKTLPPSSPLLVANTLRQIKVPVMQLPADEYLPLILRFAEGGRSGAGVYDAQIAATAKHHGMKLLSRDRRAAVTYETMGVDYELI